MGVALWLPEPSGRKCMHATGPVAVCLQLSRQASQFACSRRGKLHDLLAAAAARTPRQPVNRHGGVHVCVGCAFHSNVSNTLLGLIGTRNAPKGVRLFLLELHDRGHDHQAGCAGALR
eukprot:363717-Chlamydomonas_euryale.AAC.10